MGLGSAVRRSTGMGRRTCLRRFRQGDSRGRHWRGTGPGRDGTPAGRRAETGADQALQDMGLQDEMEGFQQLWMM